MGLLVMTWLLSYARPGELLRVRHCDLVPPLRGALQNLSGPLSRKLVPFWMALRGQSSKNPLWSFTYPTFCRFLQEATTGLTLPPLVPYRWRHSGPSIDIADGSWSLEQVKKRGRWQVMNFFKRYERHSRLRQSRESLARKSPAVCCAASRTRLIWNLVAFTERPLRGTHRLRHSASV